MGIFSKSKPAKLDHFAAIDKAIAEARSAGISAGTLMSRLEAAAESLRFSAHHESEQRRMASDNAVAANAAWADAEIKRLKKAGQWPA